MQFQLNQSLGWIGVTGAVNLGFAMAFNFSLLYVTAYGNYLGTQPSYAGVVPNSSDFTNLFDQYRIDSVEMTIISSSTNSSTATPTTGEPVIWLFNDLDDAVAPTSVGQFLEREGLRTISFGDHNVKKHRVYPRITVSAFQGVLPAYAAGGKYQWLDIAYPDIKYFGTKMYYDNSGVANNTVIANVTILFKYNMTFKGVR